MLWLVPESDEHLIRRAREHLRCVLKKDWPHTAAAAVAAVAVGAAGDAQRHGAAEEHL